MYLDTRCAFFEDIWDRFELASPRAISRISRELSFNRILQKK